MRRKWLLCGILCGVVSLSVFGQNVGASNYDKQIKETEKQQKEWENKADSLQKEIEEIQADKDDTLKYIEKLDKKTASLEEELEKLHAQVASSEKKLKVIQKELAKAQKEKEKQYTTMKRRIKFPNMITKCLRILRRQHLRCSKRRNSVNSRQMS